MSNESDWKKFRNLITRVRERYLEKQNSTLLKILADANRSETERFWDTLKRMKQVSSVLADCLDDHSRSKIEIYMRRMLRARMLFQEDLVDFSSELQMRLRAAE